MAKGKKTCPECGAEVGCRLRVCECDFKFPIKDHKQPSKKTANQPVQKEVSEATEIAPEIVCVSDPDALKRFVAQIKEAAYSARHHGGVYSAFLHHKHGVVQVEVYFPLQLRG